MTLLRAEAIVEHDSIEQGSRVPFAQQHHSTGAARNRILRDGAYCMDEAHPSRAGPRFGAPSAKNRLPFRWRMRMARGCEIILSCHPREGKPSNSCPLPLNLRRHIGV